jgi:predicted membrane protein
MHRLGFGFVLGVILMLIGASIAMHVLFHISFPLLPLALAILFVAWGSRMVVHSLGRREVAGIAAEACLADRHFAPTEALDDNARYDIVFGRGVIDLSRLPEPAGDVTVTVDTVFGAAVIKVDPHVPYDVHGSSTFGEVRMPDRTATTMGNVSFTREADHPARLHLKVNTVFGSCQLVEAT